jgi:phospholipid/cholesterol/gamma-HCH transport system ATP-binding protein
VPADVRASLIEAVEVVKGFDGTDVLRGLSLAVSKGETFTVMGGSGSGKTVLLRLIAGLIRPDRGQIRLFDQNIEELSEEELLPIRRRMGYVFQGAALFDSLTVYENVAYPLREHTTLDSAAIRERVLRFLKLVGLNDDVLHQLPSEISGGMRKRVAIARSLVNEPEVMLFDEPTAGLDPTNARLVAELISQVHGGVCDTAVVVTHDLELAKTVADRAAILIEGRFAAMGPVDAVLGSSEPAVQAFLAGEAR